MIERHTIPPVFNEKSRILILGSFPSVRSREEGFFYGHPQNRFWRTLACVFGAQLPQTVEEKRELLLVNRIALWDVVASCRIIGSSDASIKNVVPNDPSRILHTAPIAFIFTNGGTAHRLYRRYMQAAVGRTAVCLPSTSPANAAWTQEKLNNAWQVLKEVNNR